MNNNRSPHSGFVPPGNALDAEIRAAELRVIERDRRLGIEAAEFSERFQHQLRRAARVVGAASVGSFALGWAMSRGQREHRAAHLADAPWAGMVSLLWPLLPSAVRTRVSPGVASFLTGIGLPLLAQYLSRRARAKRQRAS